MARRRVANLVVGLTARAGRFNRGLRAARRVLRRFSTGVARVARRLVTMSTAMVGVAGVAGIGLLVRGSLRAVDSLAKLARGLDTSIGFMQRMEYHSGLAGVELSSLEGALRRFDRRVRIAAATGQRADFLQQMGLDARHLAEMPLENKLVTFAQALEQNVRPAERVAYAYQLFGQQAQEMMLVLDGLPRGLKDARKAIEDMGIALDKEGASRVEMFNDAMFKLKFHVRGVVQQMVIALTPALSAGLKILRDWIPSGKVAGTAIATWANAAVQGVEDIVNALRRGAAKFLEFTNTVIDAWTQMVEAQTQLLDAIADTADAIPFIGNRASQAARTAVAGFDDMLDSIYGVQAGLDDQRRALEDNEFRFEGVRNHMADFAEEARKMADAPSPFRGMMHDLEDLDDGLEDHNDLLADAADGLKDFHKEQRRGQMEHGNIFRQGVFQRAARAPGLDAVSRDRDQVRELQAHTGLLRQIADNTQLGLGFAQ